MYRIGVLGWWAVVKANNVVKTVASTTSSDPWEVHETPLMLMECDRGAQRSFLRTAEFDSFGDTQCGLLINGIGLYDLMRGILDAAQAN